MDKRAAAQYLDTLFAGREGHVAVAYKDKGQSWQECSFAWPTGKDKLLGWADVHSDANIFVCPALRKDGHTRKKGDMRPSRWLWADVDWQSVPADRVGDVKDRIKELGAMVVRSGSDGGGEPNVHVYVQLNRDVDAAEFIKLNTGLRDYLYADNKQADNSFLRLPGTTNWKTPEGSAVRRSGGVVGPVQVLNLMKRRAFRDAKVPADVDAADWSLVDVPELPSSLRRRLKMPADEAIGRYGARNAAVHGMVRDLLKKGLSSDQIHSAMHKFPAGLDKMADENGYDLHLDIARVIVRAEDLREKVEQVKELEEQIDEIFEEISAEEVLSEGFDEEVNKLLRSRQVRRAADMAEAASGYVRPPADTTTWLHDAFTLPPAPVQWLIQDMCSADATVVIAGQYKTGKTKLMIASLMSALVDGEPFLGQMPVTVPEGGAKIGHWNLEMSASDLIDKYMRPVGYKNPQNIKLGNWRGQPINLMTELGMADAVEWLRGLNVWMIDSWTALCRTCGVDPNSGKEVGMLLHRIEEIKAASGVRVCFFLAHTARSASESERPGTRGASEVDDHVDSRWVLTRDKSDVRFIQVEGRDTQLEPVSLDFNVDTGRSVVGATSRASAATDGWVQTVVKIVHGMGPGRGVNEATLIRKMREVQTIGVAKAKDFIQQADAAGFIEIKMEPRVNGRGRAEKMHYLTSDARGGGGDEHKMMDRMKTATPREVNLSDVRVRTRRRPT